MKNGYTLIELLAVIALLAILLLLLVPRVIDIYVEAKKNTFKNEALSIVTSAETKYITQAITDGRLVNCYEYNKDNNDLNGFMEYKEGYTGKILLIEDNLSINLTNGEYITKGLTKENASERDSSSIIELTKEGYSITDFSCVFDKLVNLEITAIGELYAINVSASAEEIEGLEETEKEKITYSFKIGDEEDGWTTAETSNEYKFEGLEPGTDYKVQSRVYYKEELLATSNPSEVQTLELLNPTINLTSPSKTHNSVSLIATGSDEQTGIKSGTYQFSKDNGVTWTALQSGVTYTFTGLSASTTYNFKARVQNNGGNTGTSTTLSVTTLNTPSKYLKDEIIANNPIKSGSPNFSQKPTASGAGLWSALDDYGTSYYFRGDKNLLNNNVLFGGYQWKVIRITGSGDVKLIYNGTCPNNSCSINSTGTATQIGTSMFNNYLTPADDEKYVGYTYDTNTSSIIKTYIDRWYANNIPANSKALVSDTIYCNDRTPCLNHSGLFCYGALDRIYYSPSLKCPQQVDAYTVNDIAKGNGLLTYPIGLITADEAQTSGLLYQQESSTNYLFTGQDYWTMSPLSWNSSRVSGFNFGVLYTGRIAGSDMTAVYFSIGVRPVIALKSNTKVSSGNGSATSPYIVG